MASSCAQRRCWERPCGADGALVPPQEFEHVVAHACPMYQTVSEMLGSMMVDDAIDVILPTAWKKRIPRRFR